MSSKSKKRQRRLKTAILNNASMVAVALISEYPEIDIFELVPTGETGLIASDLEEAIECLKQDQRKAIIQKATKPTRQLIEDNPQLDVLTIVPSGTNGLVKKDIELALMDESSEEGK